MRKKIKLGSICVETASQDASFPLQGGHACKSCVVTIPATSRRETCVLIRSAIRTFAFKTRRKSPISTSIANQK